MRLGKALFTLALVIAAGTSVGCDLVVAPTKMARGELYQSGDGRYDAYFAAVHQEQVASAQWVDDAKAARKPIVTALDLRPGSSNGTILSATRDAREQKAGDAALGAAVDQTTAAELERARRLGAIAARLEELKKQGEELKKQAVEDKKNLGVDKADEKKVAKRDEVKHEMAAAVDAVESMASDARRAAKEAEELATKLKATWTGKPEVPAKPDEKKEPVAKKAQPKPEAHPTPKKAPKPEGGSQEKKPLPAQKPPGEVFNP